MKKTYLIKTFTAALAVSMLLTGCLASSGSKKKHAADDDEDEIEEVEDEDEKEESEETDETTTATQRESEDKEPAGDGSYSGTIFLTEDVYGNEVGPEIFTQNKVTVVNIWGTYCGPCIEEMPELEEWYQDELAAGSGVGIVGIPIDVDSSTAYMAIDVMDDTGVTYPNLIVDDGLYEMFCQDLYCVPTTFIVDSNGEIIAGPIEGAYVDWYKNEVETYLELE